MGWTNVLPMMEYGKRFQLHRRMFQQHFSKSAITKYLPTHVIEARRLAQNFQADPQDKYELITRYDSFDSFERYKYQWLRASRFTAAVITEIVYGYEIKSNDDRYLKIAEEVASAVATTGSPGATLVDFFPFRELAIA